MKTVQINGTALQNAVKDQYAAYCNETPQDEQMSLQEYAESEYNNCTESFFNFIPNLDEFDMNDEADAEQVCDAIYAEIEAL